MAESEGLGFDSGEGLGVPSALSLPPRKRLLAGLKQQQQNGWLSSSSSSYSSSPAASTVVNSPSPASAPAPAALEGLGNPNLKSPQEIAETSKAAALAAAEVASAAKRIAVEKAAAAVKATAAAKSALELAASAAAREETEGRGFCVNVKSKPTKKKHVPIKLLYKGEQIEAGGGEEERRSTVLLRCKRSPVKAKHEPIKLSYKGKRIETKGLKDNASTAVMPHSLNDEELARQLHRAINSSPRISRNMGRLDAHHHSEKRMDSNLCSPSSSPVSPSKKSDRLTLRFVSTVEPVVSDGQHASEGLGVCAYSKAVTSNTSDWSLEAEVCNLDKAAETISKATEEEKFESREHKIEASRMEEEASCSLRCNEPVADQHCFDVKDATSVNKGLKRKKASLNTWNVEECEEAGLSKCSGTQVHSGNQQEDRLGQRTEGSPSTDESTLRSHAKQSNMRRNLERRTKSISEDFPQESDLSVEATSTCRRDILKPDQKFAGSVNLSSSAQLSHSLPPKNPIFASRSARRRT